LRALRIPASLIGHSAAIQELALGVDGGKLLGTL
jgi:hypothetical protein